MNTLRRGFWMELVMGVQVLGRSAQVNISDPSQVTESKQGPRSRLAEAPPVGGHPKGRNVPGIVHGPAEEKVVHPGVQAQAVRLCKVGDRTIMRVARDLDLTETALRGW